MIKKSKVAKNEINKDNTKSSILNYRNVKNNEIERSEIKESK